MSEPVELASSVGINPSSASPYLQTVFSTLFFSGVEESEKNLTSPTRMNGAMNPMQRTEETRGMFWPGALSSSASVENWLIAPSDSTKISDGSTEGADASTKMVGRNVGKSAVGLFVGKSLGSTEGSADIVGRNVGKSVRTDGIIAVGTLVGELVGRTESFSPTTTFVGDWLGCSVGNLVGPLVVGLSDGLQVGCTLGKTVGLLVVGSCVGLFVGCSLGDFVGASVVGPSTGLPVGCDDVGLLVVGACVGELVGPVVGARVGLRVVGKFVGDFVG